jgi:hypothetical protein
MEATGSTALSKAGDLVRTVRESGAVQDSQGMGMHDALHLGAAELPGITDARLTRQPHYRHARVAFGAESRS